MRVVVVLNGHIRPADSTWLNAADLIMAADGGANWLVSVGVAPDVVVGDLDSIDPAVQARLESAGTRFERHPVDKDASDGDLTLNAALRAGATDLVLLGALGDRLDHTLVNLSLLCRAADAGCRAVAVAGRAIVRLLRSGGSVELDADPGTLVSLVPAPVARGIRTSGLRFSLTDEDLLEGSSRGLSNVVDGSPASVFLADGGLYVMELGKEMQ